MVEHGIITIICGALDVLCILLCGYISKNMS